MKRLFCLVIFFVLSSNLTAGPILKVDGNLYEMSTVTSLLSVHRSMNSKVTEGLKIIPSGI